MRFVVGRNGIPMPVSDQVAEALLKNSDIESWEPPKPRRRKADGEGESDD